MFKYNIRISMEIWFDYCRNHTPLLSDFDWVTVVTLMWFICSQITNNWNVLFMLLYVTMFVYYHVIDLAIDYSCWWLMFECLHFKQVMIRDVWLKLLDPVAKSSVRYSSCLSLNCFEILASLGMRILIWV